MEHWNEYTKIQLVSYHKFNRFIVQYQRKLVLPRRITSFLVTLFNLTKILVSQDGLPIFSFYMLSLRENWFLVLDYQFSRCMIFNLRKTDFQRRVTDFLKCNWSKTTAGFFISLYTYGHNFRNLKCRRITSRTQWHNIDAEILGHY